MANRFGEQRRVESNRRWGRSVFFYGTVALAACISTTGASGSGCGITVNPGANTTANANVDSNTYSYSSSETFSFHGTNGNPDGQETIQAVPHCTDPAPAMPGLNTYTHNTLGVPKIPPTVLEQLVCHAVEDKWPGDDAAWPSAFYLYYRESSFDNSEGNSERAACTFAQFDPCSLLNDNFDPAHIINKALDYVGGRYTNPEGAWQHELSNDWY